MSERRWVPQPWINETPMTDAEVLAEMGGERVTRCSAHHAWWDDPEDAGCIEGVRIGDFVCDQDEVVWIVKEADK